MSETALLAVWGVGVGLLLVEMVIPGGVVGALGALLMAGSVAVAFPLLGVAWGAGLLAASLLLGGALATLAVRRLSHTKSIAPPPADEEAEALLGAQGTSTTPLRPSGFARLGGRRVDVTTGGEHIAPGTAVQVVAVQGSLLVVRALEPQPAP